MDTENSEDWYSELENNVNKLFQAKKIYLNHFNEPESWEKFSILVRDGFEARGSDWEKFLAFFIYEVIRADELGFEGFDKSYFTKQVERLLKFRTNVSGLSETTNVNEVDLTFQKSNLQKCNLGWLLIIIAYLLKEKGHQDNFHDFACSFNELVKNLKMEEPRKNAEEGDETLDSHSSKKSDEGNGSEQKKSKSKKISLNPFATNEDDAIKETKPGHTPQSYQGVATEADMLILVLAKKYLPELQEIGEGRYLESSDIDSVLKNYEWVWHGEANDKPDSFEADIKGNLCWIEIIFDKSKSGKPISTRIGFNDLMRAINNDATFVQSLRVGEPFQMHGSGLNEKGFKKI